MVENIRVLWPKNEELNFETIFILDGWNYSIIIMCDPISTQMGVGFDPWTVRDFLAEPISSDD